MCRKMKICLPALLILLCTLGCSSTSPETMTTVSEPTVTACVKSGWETVGDCVYYCDTNGGRLTDWQEIEGKRYFFDQSGVLQTGWLEMESGRYYLGADGAMVTGWLESEGERYYFRENGTMATGRVEINGEACFFSSQGKHVLLVNFENAVPDDYTPELVKVRGYRIDSSCADALEELLSACEKDGHKCKINSGYRSVERQQKLWEKRYQQYRDAGYSKKKATAKVESSVAKPGTSEHHLGLAADIGGNAKMQKWLEKHAWEYGFIVRYPEGKTEYTGIIYEPWHIRYVGKELAKELHELDLCLEEYMQLLTNAGENHGEGKNQNEAA